MEKEQILSTLNEKLGKTSLSARTIETYVDTYALPEGHEPDEAYWNNAVRMLQSLNGQLSHDVATQVEDFKKNYKPATPPTPPTPPNEPNPDGKTIEEINSLRKQIEALTGQFEQSKKNEERTKFIADVKAKMLEQGAKDKYVLDITIGKAEIDPSKSAKETAEQLLKAYDAEYTACRGAGASPRGTSGNAGGGGKPKSAAEDFFAKKGKKEGWKTN